jgi:DNA-binding response OmpR family regulator
MLGSQARSHESLSLESRGSLRLLVVEGDTKAAESLRRGLTAKGHITEVADYGIKRLAESETLPYDAIVLNIMPSGMDGPALIRSLRSGGVRVPVLILTDCDSVSDVVRGLDAGANDYLTKPFSFEVLAARLAVIVRRRTEESASTLQVADLMVNTETHSVRRGRRSVALTRTEFKLLVYLMRRAGRVALRDDIIEGVWGSDREIGNNTLDVFILLLRSKLEFGGGSRLIETVRGFGYRITAGGGESFE